MYSHIYCMIGRREGEVERKGSEAWYPSLCYVIHVPTHVTWNVYCGISNNTCKIKHFSCTNWLEYVNYQIFQETARVQRNGGFVQSDWEEKWMPFGMLINNFVQVFIGPSGSCHSAQQLVQVALSSTSYAHLHAKRAPSFWGTTRCTISPSHMISHTTIKMWEETLVASSNICLTSCKAWWY